MKIEKNYAFLSITHIEKFIIIYYVVYLNSGNCTDFCGGNLRFASPDSNNSSDNDVKDDTSVR